MTSVEPAAPGGRTIVISQPMFLPWAGLFEQAALADVFVHYDDVQLPRGRSFCTRVQLRTDDGWRWLSAPVVRCTGQTILDAQLDESQPWRERMMRSLRENYTGSPYHTEMLEIAATALGYAHRSLAEMNIVFFEAVCGYLGITCEFHRSSILGITGRSTQRLTDITRHLGGETYITGHGARHYLDHEQMEASGIAVAYIDYQRMPYPQMHAGPFNPHVTVLDLIANCGRAGRSVVGSPAVAWRQWLARQPV